MFAILRERNRERDRETEKEREKGYKISGNILSLIWKVMRKRLMCVYLNRFALVSWSDSTL